MWRRFSFRVSSAFVSPCRFMSIKKVLGDIQHNVNLFQNASDIKSKEALVRLLCSEIIDEYRDRSSTKSLEPMEPLFTNEAAQTVFTATALIHVDPRECTEYSLLVAACRQLTKPPLGFLNSDVFCEALHTMMAVYCPETSDALMYSIPECIRLAPKLDAKSLVFLITAYGRTEMRHKLLGNALAQRAKVVLTDDALLSQIANAIYGLALMGCGEQSIFDTLGKAAHGKLEQASPLVVATIFEGFTRAGLKMDDDLLSSLVKQIDAAKCDERTLASLFSTIVSQRQSSPNQSHRFDDLLGELTQRAMALAERMTPVSIVKIATSLAEDSHLDEELLGALAERGAKIISSFRSDQAALLLQSLATFELFDPELFPLLGNRLVFLSSRHACDVRDMVTALKAFAIVGEHHEGLVTAGQLLLLKVVGLSLPPRVALSVLYVSSIFPSLLTSPDATSYLKPALFKAAQHATSSEKQKELTEAQGQVVEELLTNYS